MYCFFPRSLALRGLCLALYLPVGPEGHGAQAPDMPALAFPA
jgi:hypothetical protein